MYLYKKILLLSLVLLNMPYMVFANELSGQKDAFTINKIFIEAKVNDLAITNLDVLRRAKFIVVSSKIPPTDENIQRFYKETLEQLVEELLKKERAKKYKIKVSPEDVDSNFTAIAEGNNMSAQDFENYFKKNGINVQTFKEKLYVNLLWRNYVSFVLKSQIEISDILVEQRLKLIENNYSEQDDLLYNVSEIVIIDDEDGTKAETMSSNLYKILVRDPRGFKNFAKEFSQSPSAKNAGEIGFIRVRNLPKEIAKKIVKLNVNEISPPIYNARRKVYYIVKYSEIKKEVIDYKSEEFRTNLKNTMLAERLNDLTLKESVIIRREANIEYKKN